MGQLVRGAKVLLLAEYGRMGGTRTYFKQLLALYKNHGLAVTVVRANADTDREIDVLIGAYGFDCVNFADIAKVRAGIWRKFPVCAFHERLAFRHVVRSLRPDILVASVGTPGLFAGVLGLVRRSVYILHTYPQAQDSAVYWKEYLRRFIYRYVLLRRSQVVTVSHHSGALISRVWGLNGAHAPAVIYSTVGEPIERAPVERQCWTVLTVGHVVEYKNPFIWIEVATRVVKAMGLGEIRFVWVGEGALLEECRRIVVDRGVERQIVFHGLSDDVDPFYRNCSVYFQPSLIESLGLSVLDALRHGKPCVVSNQGGLPEVVIDGECGWVVAPDDVDTMVERVCELLHNDTTYKGMSIFAAKRYDDVFAPRHWERRMIEMHENVMANGFS